MAGMYIYWFGWMFWIVIAFFTKNKEKRFWYSVLILLFMSILPMQLTFQKVTISLAYVCLCFYLCSYVRHVSYMKLIYYIIVSWTIGTAYSAFQLVLVFDPVIAFVDERWLSAYLVCIISALLGGSLKVRFQLALFGIVQGDFLASLVLHKLVYFRIGIGDMLFFDKVALISFIYSTFWVVAFFSNRLNRLLKTKVDPKQMEHSTTTSV